jgi:endonuclease/exonuclease/phosphatase family metal-dependent hydrolase
MVFVGCLAFILRSAKPDIIFLQECTVRNSILRTRASSLGFSAFQSALDPTRQLRQLVTVVRSRLRGTMVDFVLGNLKVITIENHHFLLVHAPSDSHPVDKATCGRIFREAAPKVPG